MFGTSRLWRCLAIVAALLLVIACGSVQAGDATSVLLENFAVSPDGRVVAFQFLGPKGRGVGLYEWQTGKLTRVPNPPDTYAGEPSFSYDGKYLAMGIQKRTEGAASNIAVVDLTTLALTQLTHGDPSSHRIMGNPVFQPGTDDILYVEHSILVPGQLKLLNISTGAETVVLEPNNGFYTIFRPFFVGPEEVYFQAIGPRNKDKKKDVEDLGASAGATTLTYRLHFGGLPEIVWPELQRGRKNPQQPSVVYLSASKGGKTIVGIVGEKDFYEIFELKDNIKLMRLTSLEGNSSMANISYDGTTVAFGFDTIRGRNHDLFILAMQSNKVTPTNLLAKLNGNPDFVSH